MYTSQGLTVSEIARRLGVTRGESQGMLRRAGIPRRRRAPRPLPPPSEQERRRLERLYVKEGLTVAYVGRRLGVSRDSAERLLVRADIPVRRYAGPQLPKAPELRRLYIKEKLSTRDLARRFHTHQATVWRALADAGIPRRPRGSGNKFVRGGRAPLVGSPRRRGGGVGLGDGPGNPALGELAWVHEGRS
jgi:hypothetical protein